jgi:hypothetical protein
MSLTTTPLLQVLDWCGSACGLIGAYMLAFRFRGSRYGWFAFFAANGFYVVMASGIGLPGLLAQQLGFSVSSVIGIYRHFISRGTIRSEKAREEALALVLQLAEFDPMGRQQDEQLTALIRRARVLRDATHDGGTAALSLHDSAPVGG